MEDALKRARRVHGSRALVVSHESLPDGGVALAVAKSPDELAREEERSSRKARPVLTTDAGNEHVGLHDVRSHLEEHGASAQLVERILDSMSAERLQSEHAIDVAADVIGGMFEVARSPRIEGRTQILSVIGAPGAGKTTTLIKLAYRLLRAKRRIAFATFDTHRIGAVEKLRAWGKRLHVPVAPIRRPSQVGELISKENRPELLLLDTTGHPAIDAESVAALAEDERTHHADHYVVLPATDNRGALSMQFASFGGVRLAGAVVTKIDETREPALALEEILERKLPIAFLSDGQDVRQSLHRATPDGFADVLLRGRLS